jgi:hypothetical protein
MAVKRAVRERQTMNVDFLPNLFARYWDRKMTPKNCTMAPTMLNNENPIE